MSKIDGARKTFSFCSFLSSVSFKEFVPLSQWNDFSVTALRYLLPKYLCHVKCDVSVVVKQCQLDIARSERLQGLKLLIKSRVPWYLEPMFWHLYMPLFCNVICRNDSSLASTYTGKFLLSSFASELATIRALGLIPQCTMGIFTSVKHDVRTIDKPTQSPAIRHYNETLF